MPWTNDTAARQRSSRIYGTAWRQARARQLQAQPNCQLRYEGCTYRATQVDHIYGADTDTDHRWLRSVCAPCHRKRTANEQGLGFRAGPGNRPPRADPPARPTTRW